MSQQPSDEQLMSQVKMGEVASFEILFARYQQPLFNFIIRMLGDFHKAQDIFQETFLRVFCHAQKYDESFRFSPWLYQIARNLCLEEIRRQRKVEIIPVDEEADCQPIELWDKNTPDEQLEMAETEKIVQNAILRLSEKQREVFLLRENHGLSYDEISQITNLSVSAVKSCLHRARMALKEMLAPYLKSGKMPR
ncbi:TPA: sigma-70 family RNA polymerase sigma factor [Candidatus Poribacteria bacterium]|nr:sigma-70 family RNA polymerase sigma factor [Candidatus Poribacteria bacterium]